MPAQIDRLAKVMNNFEFIDPADTLPRQLAAVGLDLNADRVRLFARLWGEMQDLPRHLGQHSGGMVICQGQLDAVRAARKRQHARPRRRAVGQGRLRRHGHRQGRSARPRHDGGDPGRARAGQRRTRRSTAETAETAERSIFEDSASSASSAVEPSRRRRSGAPAAGRSGRLPDAAARPTRSACSRSSRARRWRRCRGSSRRRSTTSSCRWRSSGPGRSSGRWCIRI